jgi:hypothetical protein
MIHTKVQVEPSAERHWNSVVCIFNIKLEIQAYPFSHPLDTNVQDFRTFDPTYTILIRCS